MSNDRQQLVKLIKGLELLLTQARQELEETSQPRESGGGATKSCNTCINFGSHFNTRTRERTPACLKFNSAPPPDFIKENDCNDYELDDIPFD